MKVVLIAAILVVASQVQAGTTSLWIKQGKTVARSARHSPSLKMVADITTSDSLKTLKISMDEKAKGGALLVREVVKSVEGISGGTGKFSIALLRERTSGKGEVTRVLNLMHHKLSLDSQKKITELLKRYNIERGGSLEDLKEGTDHSSFGMWAVELKEEDFGVGLEKLNRLVNEVYKVAATDTSALTGNTVRTRTVLGRTEK